MIKNKVAATLIAGGLLIISYLYFEMFSGRSCVQEMRESNPGSMLLEPLENIKKSYGNPNTVNQKDNIESFYYWPKEGFAVFMHPHYNRQYKTVRKEKRISTAIIFPIKKELKGVYVNILGRGAINFEKTLYGKRYLDKINKSCIFKEKKNNKKIFSSNMIGLGGFKIIIHYLEGKPRAVEIRENRIFSWYD